MTNSHLRYPNIKSCKKVLVTMVALAASSCSQLKGNELAEEPAMNVEETVAEVSSCELDKPWAETPKVEVPDLWTRIVAGYTMGTIKHERIDKHRKWYAKHPDYLARVVDKGSPYLYYIVEQIEARGMPMEIALLPVVESAFDPFAYSRTRAAGMWQFMPGTGKMLGLKQNWWYDGRRDITRSTDAALTYLQQLHKRFNGDWLLALAAYNSGAGNVSKAIRRNTKAGKPTDFFSLGLPKETRYYVPKLIALAEIYKHPERFNIPVKPIPNEQHFVKVDIQAQIDLAQAAELADIDMDTLYQLNPAYNRWATDPAGPHTLLIPVGKEAHFTQKLAQVPLDERVVWERYTIKPGDSLSTIARKYKVSIQALKDANKMRGTILRAGKGLMVPVAAAGSEHYVASIDERLKKSQARAAKKNKNSRMDYKVKRGDNLWKIATRYGVSTRSIARWNDMAPTDPIRPGQVLAIWPKKKHRPNYASTGNNKTVRKVSYKVRSGDSLYRIAQKFSLNIKDIHQWNDLKKQKYLQPGQSLTLFVNVAH